MIDFTPTGEQQDIVTAARQFAKSESPGRAVEFDREETLWGAVLLDRRHGCMRSAEPDNGENQYHHEHRAEIPREIPDGPAKYQAFQMGSGEAGGAGGPGFQRGQQEGIEQTDTSVCQVIR